MSITGIEDLWHLTGVGKFLYEKNVDIKTQNMKILKSHTPFISSTKGISESFKHLKSSSTIKSLNIATANSLVIHMLFTSKNDITGINIDSTFTIMYRRVLVGELYGLLPGGA
ncbi:hypothetical protein R6Q57_017095 [Mikania cordata]